MLVDKNLGSAKDAHAMIRDEVGEAWPFEADSTCCRDATTAGRGHHQRLLRGCIDGGMSARVG